MELHNGDDKGRSNEWKEEGLREKESELARLPKKDTKMANDCNIEKIVLREENEREVKRKPRSKLYLERRLEGY